jgi:5-methylcytosine-specific restriction endonuclease McrA
MQVKLNPGQTFGRLRFVRFENRTNWGLFECNCGTVKAVYVPRVIRGTTTSCGCRSHSRGLLPGDAIWNALYKKMRANAVVRNFLFELTFEQVKEISSRPCHYCGQLPPIRVYKFKQHFIHAHGIDRVDNALGYTLENSVSCCYMCNHAKSIYGVDEFLAWIERVYKHNIK